MRTIDADKLIEATKSFCERYEIKWTLNKLLAWIDHAPTIDAVELPCKIGDTVWFAKQYKCHKHPRKGIVSEMYFVNDMSLHIVVKNIGRGEWGKRVFGTCEEAQAAIERKETT